MQLTRVLVEIISLPYCFASSNSHIIISPAFLAFLYKKRIPRNLRHYLDPETSNRKDIQLGVGYLTYNVFSLPL